MQALVRARAAIGALDLHEAVKAGEEELAAAFLHGGASSVGTQDEHSPAPRHIAAESDTAGMAQLLLQKRPSTDKQDGKRCATPVLAAQAGRGRARFELSWRPAPIPGDWTPLEAAAQHDHGEALRVTGDFGAPR